MSRRLGRIWKAAGGGSSTRRPRCFWFLIP